jgi:prophage antirepressor-like protein
LKKRRKIMDEIKIFQNSEFGELNILVENGKELFPATDCAKVLGYD